ncbi:ABC transporter ATP-binding protein [Archaeoglobus veneficus]|uniref:Sulfate-transporting ATPase n=1 Tax=Archaeoglobus veneficus (strain DSM 11195 / SNP6) TaxID=693661 RepID=F2KNY8_ARCVS|nr:ABC transporter ATP-binding protein [Archaeoglobus veneficus]AEA46296.1 Sulfate-transporting ATPase [Archaeoglobus veneficus SNP6]
MIETENLTKLYGNFRALDNLNLYIEENEIFGFLGPNGAGKTTTINLLMGMLQPTSGKIRISGIDVLRNPLEVKKICGYLPENVGFYDNLTAKQNLLYFSEFYKIAKGEAVKRVDELLERVGLNYAADKKVGEFSKGMKQRLGMAQALLNDPDVIFLDEPTSGLDPKGAADFRKLIRELAGEGKTIFFSSHILSEVKEICDTIGIILRGKLIVRGKLKELVKGKVKVLIETQPALNESLVKHLASKIELNGSKVILETEEDCRAELSKILCENGYLIKELRLMEPGLEEIYLKVIEEGEL